MYFVFPQPWFLMASLPFISWKTPIRNVLFRLWCWLWTIFVWPWCLSGESIGLKVCHSLSFVPPEQGTPPWLLTDMGVYNPEECPVLVLRPNEWGELPVGRAICFKASQDYDADHSTVATPEGRSWKKKLIRYLFYWNKECI